MSRFTSRGTVAEIGAATAIEERPITNVARDVGSAALSLAWRAAAVYWIYRWATKEKKR